MKWIKLLIDIALVLIPGLGLKAKNNVDQELMIAKATINVLSKNASPQAKGEAIEEAIHSLKFFQDFKGRALKKLNKAKTRFYKKIF